MYSQQKFIGRIFFSYHSCTVRAKGFLFPLQQTISSIISCVSLSVDSRDRHRSTQILCFERIGNVLRVPAHVFKFKRYEKFWCYQTLQISILSSTSASSQLMCFLLLEKWQSYPKHRRELSFSVIMYSFIDQLLWSIYILWSQVQHMVQRLEGKKDSAVQVT